MIDFVETHVEFILEFLHVLFPLDGESFWPRNSTKMWKYFTHRETLTYVDVLSEETEKLSPECLIRYSTVPCYNDGFRPWK
jgi:hypothetical protein